MQPVEKIGAASPPSFSPTLLQATWLPQKHKKSGFVGQKWEITLRETPPGLEPPASFASPGCQQPASLPLLRPPPGLEPPTSHADFGYQEEICACGVTFERGGRFCAMCGQPRPSGCKRDSAQSWGPEVINYAGWNENLKVAPWRLDAKSEFSVYVDDLQEMSVSQRQNTNMENLGQTRHTRGKRGPRGPSSQMQAGSDGAHGQQTKVGEACFVPCLRLMPLPGVSELQQPSLRKGAAHMTPGPCSEATSFEKSGRGSEMKAQMKKAFAKGGGKLEYLSL
jgi:hypothetical protein